MSKFDDHVERYADYLALPWQDVAGAARVLMVVYDMEQERLYRARRAHFEEATKRSGHNWVEIDITDSFAQWMAADKYRDQYFRNPNAIGPKIEKRFPEFVANRIAQVLDQSEADAGSVVAVFGVGALYGLTRVSTVIGMVESKVRGRLAVFFPGAYSDNNYRLLDARDGWNYMAVPIL